MEEEEEEGGVVQREGSLLSSLALSLEGILCGHHPERGTVWLRVHCWGQGGGSQGRISDGECGNYLG